MPSATTLRGWPKGSEFRVNTYTTGQQINPSVGMDSAGDFVIAWESKSFSANPEDGSGVGVYAQRQHNSSGVAVGSQFQVNTYTAGNQKDPAVAMDSAGDFVIAWQSGYTSGTTQDGSGYGVYAQRYNAGGVAQGSEFRVNTYTTGNQELPSVAMDSAGDFVVAWQSGYTFGTTEDGSSYGIYAQRHTTPAGWPRKRIPRQYVHDFRATISRGGHGFGRRLRRDLAEL